MCVNVCKCVQCVSSVTSDDLRSALGFLVPQCHFRSPGRGRPCKRIKFLVKAHFRECMWAASRNWSMDFFYLLQMSGDTAVPSRLFQFILPPCAYRCVFFANRKRCNSGQLLKKFPSKIFDFRKIFA